MLNSLLISLIFLLLVAATNVAALGTLGGKIQVPDVKSNKEVQDLGRFSVDQYNKNNKNKLSRRQGGDGASAQLEFDSVVVAEKQVVAGIKYYLTIQAKEGGTPKTFTSEVVVNPNKQSKELLNFSPSSKPLSPVIGEGEAVRDPSQDAEVQRLGKFAIEQFNTKNHSLNGVSKPLEFESVIKAQKQLVHGIMYRLRILAKDTGVSEPFHAEVLVDPAKNTTELISFAPATFHNDDQIHKVGGKTEVTVDKEIQELGKFAVVEFNEHRHSLNGVSRRLVFDEVVKAETQVVAGTKYHMKVKAHEDGVTKYFDVEVVLEAGTGSKKLLDFMPSSQ